MAAKHTWTDHTIFESSKPNPKTGKIDIWKVQINELGQFRCSCPSFIYSRVSPRTCKHARRCEVDAAVVAKPVAPVVAPEQAPHFKEAVSIFDAMCAQAATKVRFNVKNQIGLDGVKVMVDVLAAKLAVFVPPPPKPATVGIITGVRRITFDD